MFCQARFRYRPCTLQKMAKEISGKLGGAAFPAKGATKKTPKK
jgi:hypothetical protein